MRRSTRLIMCLGALLCLGLAAPVVIAMDGGNATVSFGQWQTGPAPGPPPVLELNRFHNLSPRDRNNHQLIPNDVTIKAGGAVNFLIGGFHQPIVYDDGTQPEDINVNTPPPPTTTRGPNPFPQDHPSVIAAYEWVTEQFEHGRQTSIEWEELQPLMHDLHVLA